jgi:O-antigen ligase
MVFTRQGPAHRTSIPRSYVTFVLLLLVSFVAIFLALEHLGLRPEPYWIALAILVIPVAMAVIRRFPAALIPLVTSVGAFKMQPAASNLDFGDPSFWALLLLIGTMLLHALLALAGLEYPSLGDRVRGQLAGIVTYLIFVGVVAVSYTYSRAPEYGFRAMTHFAVIGSVIYFAPLFLVRSETDIRHLITSTLLLSTAIVAQEYLTRKPETVTDPTRLDAGLLTGLGLLVLLLPPKAMRVRLPRLLLLLCIPWLAAGLIISLARGPALSCIVILMLAVLTSKRQTGLLSRKATIVIFLMLVIPTVLMSLQWLQQSTPKKLNKKEWELSNLLELSDPGGTAGLRLELYRLAIRGFAEKPVLGWGIGSYSVYANGTDMRLYPHNLVLLTAMEQGSIGLAALVAFAGAVGRALKKSIAATGEWTFLLWIILYSLSTSMFSGSLDDQRQLILWSGVAFAVWRMLKTRFEQPPHGDELASVDPPMPPR